MIQKEVTPIPHDELTDWIKQLFKLTTKMAEDNSKWAVEVRIVANAIAEAWAEKA